MSSQIDRPMEAIRWEYETWKVLFQSQPSGTRGELDSEAGRITDSLLHNSSQVRFSLPRRVICQDLPSEAAETVLIPEEQRAQIVKNRNSLPFSKRLDQHLSKLEKSSLRGISTAAALIRYATAERIVRELSLADACAFPGWIGSIEGVQAALDSLRSYKNLLQAANTIAPYLAGDEIYLQQCEALHRQIADRGRSLAGCITEEIIATIKQREESAELNRGLSLSLPYFDDQVLDLKTYDFEVIPRGRILFEPAYVMWVARHEQREVEQNPGLSASARQQLLVELRALEKAFEVPGAPIYRRRSLRRKKLAKTGFTSLRVALSAISVTRIKK
jgi:hypothetical protein